jgi:hypothetical protein
MKHFIYILFFCLTLTGCDRYSAKQELNEKTFDANTMAYIKETAKFDIPAGAKGLNFTYKPPVDPMFFAKILIPEKDEKLVETQIEALKNSPSFPNGFGDSDCVWWPIKIDNVVVSRKSMPGDYFLEAYLVKENGQIVLYLKYFTM